MKSTMELVHQKNSPKNNLKETQKTRLKERSMNRSTTFKNNCSPVANQMTKQSTEVLQGAAAADDLDI